MQRLNEATQILNLKPTLFASELEGPSSTTSTGASTPSEFPLDGTPMMEPQDSQVSWADLEEDGWSDADAAHPLSPSRTSRRRTRNRRRARATRQAETALAAAAESSDGTTQMASDLRDRAVVTWMDLGLGFDEGKISSSASATSMLQAHIIATEPSWGAGAISTHEHVTNDASGRHKHGSYCLPPGIATTPIIIVPDGSPQAAVHAFMIPVLQSSGMQSSAHLEATLRATAPDVYED
eukprot:TRINITY_DN13287_c0_g1_i2.p1 TRINITY_DN13287_c0_g1~~TRINITY_DN13287_c0_g1_i2.p1  ORF type:complete len:238 (+),score=42.02 TRINITY_DN13287_c0_g1_i2:153-866(+)